MGESGTKVPNLSQKRGLLSVLDDMTILSSSLDIWKKISKSPTNVKISEYWDIADIIIKIGKSFLNCIFFLQIGQQCLHFIRQFAASLCTYYCTRLVQSISWMIGILMSISIIYWGGGNPRMPLRTTPPHVWSCFDGWSFPWSGHVYLVKRSMFQPWM